jgi:hypothetical protein
MKTKNIYDLNNLLKVAVVCICITGIVLYCNTGENQFINVYTILIQLLFGVQIILFLSYERRRRDPFILILCIVNIFFYMGRIDSLLYDLATVSIPFSNITRDVLMRFSGVTAYDVNCTLIFIILSNTAIFLGLVAPKEKIPYLKRTSIRHDSATFRGLVIILIFIIIMKDPNIIPGDILGVFGNTIRNNLFDNSLIIMLLVIISFIGDRYLGKISKVLIGLALAYMCIFQTLHGSRATIMGLGFFILFALLSVKNRIIFNKKWVFLLTIIIPISIIMFFQTTYLRQHGGHRPNITYSERIDLLKEGITTLGKGAYTLPLVFARTGYLDWAVDKVANAARYKIFLNPVYCFKSIIDNGLSPGFNVFDVPGVSSAVRFVYLHIDGIEFPTIEDSEQRGACSDMLTAYGEFYVLFGWYPALFFFFMFSYAFKRVYLSFRSRNVLFLYLCRSSTLLVFYVFLNSFGLDGLLRKTIFIIINLFALNALFMFYTSFTSQIRVQKAKVI